MRTWISILAFLILTHSTYASALTGGELSYRHIEGYDYEVTIRLYSLCVQGAPPLYDEIYLFVFKADGSTHQIQAIQAPAVGERDTVPQDIWQACLTFPNKPTCIEVSEFSTRLTLPPTIGGYDLTWGNCCRFGGTQNMVTILKGMTMTAHIPGPEVVSQNSNPIFKEYPPLFLCF